MKYSEEIPSGFLDDVIAGKKPPLPAALQAPSRSQKEIVKVVQHHFQLGTSHLLVERLEKDTDDLIDQQLKLVAALGDKLAASLPAVPPQVVSSGEPKSKQVSKQVNWLWTNHPTECEAFLPLADNVIGWTIDHLDPEASILGVRYMIHLLALPFNTQKMVEFDRFAGTFKDIIMAVPTDRDE